MAASARRSSSAVASVGSDVSASTKWALTETGVPGSNHTWFIAYAGPQGEKPRLAIAVVVEDQHHCTGGRVSAPIAKAVMEALLRKTANE